MLQRQHRLSKEKDIRFILRRGRTLNSSSLILRVACAKPGKKRFAVVVGTRVSKKAVVRNRLKRQIRAILRMKVAAFPSGCDYLLSVRAGSQPTYQQLLEDLKSIHSHLVRS